MEAGRKDRPPMLAPGNYVQWKSRIKRYIDTKPNHELIYYCLENPPYKLDWKDIEVPISEGKIRDQLNAKAEAVQIIITGIDNDIYSTVDACSNACEMWKAIERKSTNLPTTNLRTSSNTSRANHDNSLRINRSVGYENQRIGNVAGAREIVDHYMYMAQLQEVSPDAAGSGPIFDDEPLQKISNDDHYKVFAMKSAHPEQSKSVHDTYLIEQ
nr:hypothetical protein [Tanacetum cinerariifolium]